MDDAERVGILGSGTKIQDAANKKAGRIRQIDKAVDEATGTGPVAVAPAASAPQGAMSQSQFGGPQESAQQKMEKQRKLAEILRNRQ